MPELIMVLAIAAVLLMLGLPDLRAMIARQQLRAAANDLFASIDLTRSHAITRSRRVLMVPVGAAGVAAGDWRQGWTVFVDKNGNLRPDAGDDVIFTRGALAPGIAIHSNFPPLAAWPTLLIMALAAAAAPAMRKCRVLAPCRWSSGKIRGRLQLTCWGAHASVTRPA